MKNTKKFARKWLALTRRGAFLREIGESEDRSGEWIRRVMLDHFGKREVEKARKEGARKREKAINRPLARMLEANVPMEMIEEKLGLSKNHIHYRIENQDSCGLLAKAMEKRSRLKNRQRLDKAKRIWALRKLGLEWKNAGKPFGMNAHAACSAVLNESKRNPGHFKGRIQGKVKTNLTEAMTKGRGPKVRTLRMKWSKERRERTAKKREESVRKAEGWIDEIEKGTKIHDIAAREKKSTERIRSLMRKADNPRYRKAIKARIARG